MQKINRQQQLEIIEGLCLLFEDGDINDIKRAKDILTSIYKVSHLNGSCENEHLDWHEEAIALAKALYQNGIADIQGIEEE